LAHGFTLIELVMVIVLVGVLAIFAAPRLFDSAAFNARGFHDETLAFLRYAQKTAIAQRRTVCVAFTLSSATLKVDNDGSAGCEANLAGPRGDSPGTITARGDVSYSNLPTAISFDALGQPTATQTIQVQGAGRSITVEAGTGYVHE
jgi:MSHA pilin protein MshC